MPSTVQPEHGKQHPDLLCKIFLCQHSYLTPSSDVPVAMGRKMIWRVFAPVLGKKKPEYDSMGQITNSLLTRQIIKYRQQWLKP